MHYRCPFRPSFWNCFMHNTLIYLAGNTKYQNYFHTFGSPSAWSKAKDGSERGQIAMGQHWPQVTEIRKDIFMCNLAGFSTACFSTFFTTHRIPFIVLKTASRQPGIGSIIQTWGHLEVASSLLLPCPTACEEQTGATKTSIPPGTGQCWVPQELCESSLKNTQCTGETSIFALKFLFYKKL